MNTKRLFAFLAAVAIVSLATAAAVVWKNAVSRFKSDEANDMKGQVHSQTEHTDSIVPSNGAPGVPDPKTESWRPGMPHPIEPEDPDMPSSGTNSLRKILGWRSEWHVFNSVNGLYSGSGDDVPYEMGDRTVFLHLGPDWTVEVEKATGIILPPADLPTISDKELSDIAWSAMERDEELRKWSDAFQAVKESTDKGGVLAEVRLDAIRRVSDKAFVAWRLVEDPPDPEGGFIRCVYWIDVRTRRIVWSGTEINENR